MSETTPILYDVRISCPSCGGNKNYELSPATDDNENERWFLCLKKGELCPQFSIVNKG
jgi:hypothetical protein